MSSEMRELVKEMRAGTPCYVAKVGGGRCVNGAECLRCAERLDWADRLERALLARTEAGADGAVGYVSADGNAVWLTEGSFSLKPAAGTNLFTHPQDASGDAEDRKALEYLMGQFDAEVHVCARCGHEDSTRDCDSAIYLRRHLGAMQQTNGGGE